MPSVEIVAVGTELLLGQLVDTNTAHIAQALAASGIDVYAAHAVGDNRERIAATLRAALDRADGVVTSGGLGPTVDDLTKEATCDALGVDAVMDDEALQAMQERFAVVVGREMPANNRKQALLPRGALAMPNPHGSAPGYIAFRCDGKFVASMPGVPSEMKPMLADRLLPWLREKFGAASFITTRVLHTVGIAESELDERIGDLFATQENPKIAVLAHGGRCDVKLMAKTSTQAEARALIEPLEIAIRARLENVIFGVDEQTLESVVLQELQERGQTLAVAESCTGGRLSASLTRVPGASKGFVGGIVAYDNSVKIQHLGVKIDDLDAHGAVSSEVAAAMAAGARERFGVSIAISVTGIAGPEGGTPEKPVGLVWFGLAGPSGVKTRKMQFRGDREIVQQRATAYALALLWRRVTQAEPNETVKT
jgi:nicotinamide-nucleotide amidase